MKAQSTSDARLHKSLFVPVVIAFLALFSFDMVREGIAHSYADQQASIPAPTVSNHDGIDYIIPIDGVVSANNFFDAEEDVVIENWMSDLRLWKKPATVEAVSEEIPQLKSWMFNADWLSSSCTEIVAVQHWMGDTSSWCLTGDEIVPLCAWMFGR